MNYNPSEIGQKIEDAISHASLHNRVYLFTHENPEHLSWDICWRAKGKLTGGTLYSHPFGENREAAWRAFEMIERSIQAGFAQLYLMKVSESYYNC